MTELDVPLSLLVRQVLEPGHILWADDLNTPIERMPCRIVVLFVPHPTGHGSIMVSKDSKVSDLSNSITDLIRIGSVANRIT